MPLRDELLIPIPGENPGGAELRYDPVYNKIKEARREDDDSPQGEWQTTRKTADWTLVIKLTKDALATKSKDLQLAAWLTEALLRREGFAGLRAGIDLLSGLVDEHWDHLFPEIEDGDAEIRAAPLEWVGLKLEFPVRMAPINRAGHGLIQYKEMRTVPTEASVVEDPQKLAAREAAIAAGKLAPEEFERGFTATPKVWFRSLVADLDGSLEALQALDDVSRAKFGDVAPTYAPLKDALEEVLRTANQLLKRKLELDPDPLETTAGAPGDGPGAASPGAGLGGSLEAGVGARSLSVEPTSRDDAAARIVGAARFLRQADPLNPAPYLLLRGFRWGELRAAAGSPDPRLLEAPATPVRTNLKGLLLDARWKDLLEAAEGVMGTPQGRGWLDLQRYTLTACDALGSDYHAVATAMRGALRALLADLPQLVDMTLMDDTPTANVETRAWLRATIYVNGTGPAPSPHDGDGSAADDGESRVRDPLALAAAEVRAGRPDRAITLLMREAAREKTKRGRFLCQSQLASIMVDAGHEAVAMPILEELLASIEAHKLEDWEAGDLVAAPMALLYACLQKTEGDPVMRQSLYLRICRLDPLQAISFAQH